MDKELNHWSDALSEQDIPAEAVQWENIIADPEDAGLDEAAALLDAEATIGELPAEDEDE
ncbi:hypothetical protein KDC22_05200 [Paenibacillus tritici]|jgi:hypothetical protein|uniref:hypothetical protein n=1 Tax=Paenibacillus tritici TaxID=1873425 RepID=UPI001BA5732D|nr:hypothetical protein [Paenibacillus tritici]QUL55942.1 hypothetical protein KDC22_05200 [Paenibacillus tritici]